MEAQKVLTTPPAQWVPEKDEEVWARVPGRDGRMAMVRSRVESIDEQAQTALLELYPALPVSFMREILLSDISPLK